MDGSTGKPMIMVIIVAAECVPQRQSLQSRYSLASVRVPVCTV
jgi:hypothetical protein